MNNLSLLALPENFIPLAGHGQWAGCMDNQHGKPALKHSTSRAPAV